MQIHITGDDVALVMRRQEMRELRVDLNDLDESRIEDATRKLRDELNADRDRG